MAKRLLLPRSQAVGLDGRPLAGAKLLTYITGTSTPKPVFTDAALTVPHANPVVADQAGRFPAMFLGAGDYRTVLTDAADVVIASDDPVEGDSAAAAADIATAALAASRNRIVNPAMQLSQQFGTSNTDCTTAATYTLDQWIGRLSTTPGGTLRIAQVASPTPGGSPFRLRATAQVADGTLAAGDFYAIEQPIEGTSVADARFGSAAAKPLMLRFGLRSSVAGTFGVSIRNGINNRSYVSLVTIGAAEVNTDILRVLTVPGDTAGSWITDTGAGLRFTICLASGSTFQGTAGSWQAGELLTTAGQTNFMGTGAATFELFDVGLYVDTPGLNVLPPFQAPEIGEDLFRASRYYQRIRAGIAGQSVGAGAFYSSSAIIPVPMRATPVVTNLGTIVGINTSGSAYDDIANTGFRFTAISLASGAFVLTQDLALNARI
jgi:hypothetical protein